MFKCIDYYLIQVSLPSAKTIPYVCKKWKPGHEPTSPPPTEIPVGHCVHDGSSEFRGYCYKFIGVDASLTWSAAALACEDESNNYQLASIHSEREAAFIKTMYSYLGDNNWGTIWWIGASDADEEGKWKNTDGTTFDYTHWEGNEPNNQVKAPNNFTNHHNVIDKGRHVQPLNCLVL